MVIDNDMVYAVAACIFRARTLYAHAARAPLCRARARAHCGGRCSYYCARLTQAKDFAGRAVPAGNTLLRTVARAFTLRTLLRCYRRAGERLRHATAFRRMRVSTELRTALKHLYCFSLPAAHWARCCALAGHHAQARSLRTARASLLRARMAWRRGVKQKKRENTWRGGSAHIAAKQPSSSVVVGSVAFSRKTCTFAHTHFTPCLYGLSLLPTTSPYMPPGARNNAFFSGRVAWCAD